MYQQYLSFDVATKSLAFIKFQMLLPELREKILLRVESFIKLCRGNMNGAKLESIEKMILKADELLREMKHVIVIEDAETMDLFPDTDNREIRIVPRVVAATKYIKRRITGITPETIVFVEFQMAPNNKAGHVEAAIISIFADNPIIEVHPSVKSKIYFSKELMYHNYTKMYETSKTANKNHARDNFIEAEKLFVSSLPPMTNALKGHIADAFINAFYALVKK